MLQPRSFYELTGHYLDKYEKSKQVHKLLIIRVIQSFRHFTVNEVCSTTISPQDIFVYIIHSVLTEMFRNVIFTIFKLFLQQR